MKCSELFCSAQKACLEKENCLFEKIMNPELKK